MPNWKQQGRWWRRRDERATGSIILYLVPMLLISMTLTSWPTDGSLIGWATRRPRIAGRLSLNPLKHLDPVGTAMFVITYLFWGVRVRLGEAHPGLPVLLQEPATGDGIVGRWRDRPPTSFLRSSSDSS